MNVKVVGQGFKLKTIDTQILGIYNLDNLKYNALEKQYYQFLKIKSCNNQFQTKEIKIPEGYEKTFFAQILKIFTTDELYRACAFRRLSDTNFIGDGLPNKGEGFLIKLPTNVKAFLVNDEIVAIGGCSTDLWIRLEIDFNKEPIEVYDLESLQTFFINKESQKLQEKHKKVVAHLEMLTTNIYYDKEVRTIQEAINVLKNIDLTI